MSKIKAIIVMNKKESVISSLTKDIFMFLMLTGLFFVNYKYLGDSSILKIIFTVFFILSGIGISQRSKEFTSKADAIKHIDQLDI
jgi:hypothetical protein